MTRRELADRIERVRAILLADPELSTTVLAERLGVTIPTAARVRKQAEEA